MSDFSQISDMSEDPYLSDENIAFNQEIQTLKQNLAETYITKFFRKKYILKMQGSKSKNSANLSNKEYFKKYEQIDEVKYNFFMILQNRCKINEEYSSIINPQNEFKLRRLAIQKCTIKNNLIIPQQKQYSFIPMLSNKGKGEISSYEFPFDKDIISIEIKRNSISKLIINNIVKEVKDEETFLSKKQCSLPKIEINLKERASHPKSDKGKQKNKTEKLNADIKVFSQNNDEISSFKSNDSLTEFLGKTVYVEEGDSIIRYIYRDSYNKEIDGIYTKHNGINLNTEDIIDFNDLIDKQFVYNDNNDLKAHIIFKNFKEDKIKEDEPFLLEIKKNFKLYELMQQIKQDSKILGNIHLKTDNIAIPKYIIGVLCQYSEIGIVKEIEALNSDHINYDIKEINHIKNILEENDINVVVCMINGEKIGNYPLGEEDYKIKDEDIKYRVDISFMYKKIFNQEIDKELLSQIIEENKQKYRSITAEKEYTYDEYKKIKDEKNTLQDEKNALQKENNELIDFLKQSGLMEEYEKRRKNKDG